MQRLQPVHPGQICCCCLVPRLTTAALYISSCHLCASRQTWPTLGLFGRGSTRTHRPPLLSLPIVLGLNQAMQTKRSLCALPATHCPARGATWKLHTARPLLGHVNQQHGAERPGKACLLPPP